MEDFDETPFVWTFPVYVIGANLVTGPNGELSITEQSKLVSPEVESEPYLAVFTDLDLAERYRQICDPFTGYFACPLPARDLLLLLHVGPPEIQGILIDPNPKTLIATTAPKAEVIEDLESYIRDNL